MQPWTFLHVTDIHVGSPRSFRYAPAWVENWRTARRQMVGIKPDFLLVGGDVSRDGNVHKYELTEIKADLERLPFPCRVIPGNMDTGNKHARVSSGYRDDVSFNLSSSVLEQFVSVFGAPWWSFDHKGVRFSGFCDILVNSGLPEERDLWRWLEAQARRERPRHHVWLMHYALFADRPDEPNWNHCEQKDYHNWYFTVDQPGRGRLVDVFKATGADMVLSGHIHCRKQHEVDGIRCYLGPSTAFGQWAARWPDGDATLGFQRFDVNDAGIDCIFVPLARVSDLKGYGPGGHVAPEKQR